MINARLEGIKNGSSRMATLQLIGFDKGKTEWYLKALLCLVAAALAPLFFLAFGS